ncbi:MAG: glycine cleavage system aminomethyltransferase GcvT [Thermomicrobiales bacterium]|nr:glycine cleavage system aminomethyltransferase GcvT [Thermomicrobiales bacterium]
MGEGENQDGVRQTPLYDRHVALGAKMIPFAGWMMPVQYAGIIAEHRTVRTEAGLFDLGHMGQVSVTGPDALPFLQYVATNDVSKLEPGAAQYAMLTNEQGGVVDDIIIYREPSSDGYMVVVNASNKDKDVAWMQEWAARRNDLQVSVEDISDRLGMVAIQGPKSDDILATLTSADLAGLPGFHLLETEVAGIPVKLARTGYTGEDGFEIYPAIERSGELWDALMAAGAGAGLQPIGLGARDTLRLEARMPLYGNELGDDISPLEAGLGWAVALDKGEFIGSGPIVAQKAAGVPRKTVGFRMTERSGAPRSHCPVQVDGVEVGFVTSGAMSPTLGENIGLALVESSAAGVGKPLEIVIRDKPYKAEQIKLPFYRRSEAR